MFKLNVRHYVHKKDSNDHGYVKTSVIERGTFQELNKNRSTLIRNILIENSEALIVPLIGHDNSLNVSFTNENETNSISMWIDEDTFHKGKDYA